MSDILEGHFVFNDNFEMFGSTRRLGIKSLHDNDSAEFCIEDDQKIIACIGIDRALIGKVIRALQCIKEELDDQYINRLITGAKQICVS